MRRRPWYKRYPSDFISGTLSLTLEEKGAYSMVLDLMHDRGGPIPDDSQWIARVCGCSTRRWNQIRGRLIGEGKITVVGNTITNRRAENDIFSGEKEAEKLAESGRKGAEKTNKKIPEEQENNDLDIPLAAQNRAAYQILETRKKDSPNGESKESSPQWVREFEEWYHLYPRKRGRGQAEKAFRAARKHTDLETLVAGVKRYAAERAGEDARFVKHPATWLNGKCWLDEPEESGGRDDIATAVQEHLREYERSNGNH